MSHMVQYRQLRLGSMGWRGVVGLVVAAAAGLALIVLALGLALILVPVVAVVLLIGNWRLRKLQAAADRNRRDEYQAAGIVDAEYTVIERDTSRIR